MVFNTCFTNMHFSTINGKGTQHFFLKKNRFQNYATERTKRYYSRSFFIRYWN